MVEVDCRYLLSLSEGGVMPVLTAGQLINRIEEALRRGVPHDSVINVQASSILFEWVEERER